MTGRGLRAERVSPAVGSAAEPGRLCRLADVLTEAAEIVRDLARRQASAEPLLEYRTGERLPPGVSRRTFHRVCLSGSVAGAAKEGRTWSCRADAWHTARARTTRPRGNEFGGGANALNLKTPPDIEALADAAVRNAASLRRTRRTS